MDPQSDIKRKLSQINREAEERDAKRRALKLKFPYLDLSTAPLEVDALGLMSEEAAQHAKSAIIGQKRNDLVVVSYDPGAAEAKKFFDALKAKKFALKISVVSLAGLEHVWSFYQFIHGASNEITGKVQINKAHLEEFHGKLNTLEKAVAEIQKRILGGLGAGDLLEIFLASALSLGASDIHLEPENDSVKLRLRLDGLLHDIFKGIKKEDYGLLLSRIKLLSGLKLNIHHISQDGRFTIGVKEKEVEIRVSVLPSEYGETVVFRILDPETIQLKLNDLGLRPDDLELVQTELAKPNGMVLNTGPTGSGKTTTLYAFLLHVQNPEVKVITIENPIEYRLPGIEQTQIDEESGYTFENGLRAIVRQDPDIILVGEIRDKETAEIAMHASLTGHLVFSTLHTNDSFGTIPRLIDLGVKPSVLGPALNLIIAQRLVRKLCEKCRKPVAISHEYSKHIAGFLQKLNSRVNQEDYQEIKLFEASGCEACGKIGYKGRIAIFEFLRVDDEISEVIYKEPSEQSIKEAAKKQGVISLQEDGILKAISGITTLEEVQRITRQIPWLKGSKKSEAESTL